MIEVLHWKFQSPNGLLQQKIIYSYLVSMSNLHCVGISHEWCQMGYFKEYKISTLINSASMIDDKLSMCHISKGERHSYSYVKSLSLYLLSTYSKTKAILSHYWFLSGNVLLCALWSYTTENYFSGSSKSFNRLLLV